MIRKRLTLTIAAVALVLSASAQSNLSPTKYNWSGLSAPITAGKTTPYDKFHAIYRWLCDNIAYDTSYSIYTADECYENKRGVCQAYSEMFCRIAEAEGLKAEVVNGLAKTEKGGIDDMGHAWVFAYTDPEKGQGILIDPTWGAGSVNGDVFTHTPGDDSWFDVRPEWMIFTHLPDNDAYQLMQRKVSRAEFESLPNHNPFLKTFGFDPSALLNEALSGSASKLPQCFIGAVTEFGVKSARIPMKRDIRVGEPIDFSFETNVDAGDILALGSGVGNGNNGIWQRQGNHIVGRVWPARQGEVNIGIKNKKGSYTTLVQYNVLSPDNNDISRLEAARPELSPVWESVGNFRADILKEKGVDMARLLTTVKNDGIRKLPMLYSQDKYAVQNIPWNGELRVGNTYTFEFLPYSGKDCAIIVGDTEKDWYREWKQDPATGAWCMTVTPQKAGKLSISLQREEGGSFWTCIEYEVK